MKTKDYLIIALLLVIIFTVFDGCKNQKVIRDSKKEIKTLQSDRKELSKELNKVFVSSQIKLNSIKAEKKKDSIQFKKQLSKIDRLNKSQVKKELLKDIKPNKDSTEFLNFTLSEAKEIFRKSVKQADLINQQGFTIETYEVKNEELIKSIVIKDNVIMTYEDEIVNKDTIFKQYKKKKRKQIIKVGLISFGVGAVVVAILK